MKIKPILLMFIFFSLNSSAATLATLVSALSLSSEASYSANDWSSINGLKEVKWNHKGLRETPSSPFTKSGKIVLQHLGKAEISFSGARSMIFQLDINVAEKNGHIFEKNEFSSILKSQFSNSTTIRLKRGGCSEEGELSGNAVYEITLPKLKPVYVLISTDSGGNTPYSRSSSFQFSLENEEQWRCNS